MQLNSRLWHCFKLLFYQLNAQNKPALHWAAHPSSSDPSWQSLSPSHTWLYITHSRPSLHGLKPLRHLSGADLALSTLMEAWQRGNYTFNGLWHSAWILGGGQRNRQVRDCFLWLTNDVRSFVSLIAEQNCVVRLGFSVLLGGCSDGCIGLDN